MVEHKSINITQTFEIELEIRTTERVHSIQTTARQVRNKNRQQKNRKRCVGNFLAKRINSELRTMTQCMSEFIPDPNQN